MNEQQNTQQPVAWCELTNSGSIAYFDGRPMIMTGEVGNECHTKPLYTAPPVPRDVLILLSRWEAFGKAMLKAGSILPRNLVADTESALAARYASQVQTEPVNQQQVGVYCKFNVNRTDGRDQPGGDRQGAEYFVLDVTHDKFAKPALAAYAAACRDAYPSLADDMVRRYAIAAEAAGQVDAPDLAAQLRALAQQHGWNFVWAMARQIEDGTKNCHKCHSSALTHNSRCVHYDKAKEQAAVTEYRTTQQPASAQPVAWCELNGKGEIAYFDGKPIFMPGAVGNECHPVPLFAAQPVAVPDGVVRATELAAAAIYFADSSDYLSALWDILRFLSPDIAALAESDTRAAWERAEQARAMLSAAKKPEGGE